MTASSDQYAVSQVVRAPSWPAQAALAAAILAALLVAGDVMLDGRAAFTCAIVGYVVGALATPVLVQVYRFLRSAKNRSPWFNPSATLDRLSTTAMTTGLVSGAVHAFFIATELAK